MEEAVIQPPVADSGHLPRGQGRKGNVLHFFPNLKDAFLIYTQALVYSLLESADTQFSYTPHHSAHGQCVSQNGLAKMTPSP